MVHERGLFIATSTHQRLKNRVIHHTEIDHSMVLTDKASERVLTLHEHMLQAIHSDKQDNQTGGQVQLLSVISHKVILRSSG